MTYEPTMKTKLPTWLNGQKIAILGVVVAVGAMMQTGSPTYGPKCGQTSADWRWAKRRYARKC